MQPVANDPETMILLGRLDGKLDALINQTAGIHNTLEKHDHRIGVLERWRAYVLGAAAVAGAVAHKVFEFIFTKGV